MHIATTTTHPSWNGTVVRVIGDVDLLTAARLHDRLRRAVRLGGLLLVDLSDVRFMDCAGVGVLVRCRAEAGGRLHLYRPPRTLTRIQELTGMERAFIVVELQRGRLASAAGI